MHTKILNSSKYSAFKYIIKSCLVSEKQKFEEVSSTLAEQESKSRELLDKLADMRQKLKQAEVGASE
jgi:hypothetical protein